MILKAGDKVEHDGVTRVVKAVRKNRVVLADPTGERETIAVKPDSLGAAPAPAPEPEAVHERPAPPKREKKRKATKGGAGTQERIERASIERATRTVEDGLGAVVIAETDDDGGLWRCPPMDTTMIAGHLKLLHGIELRGLDLTEDEMLRHHEELHEAPFAQPAVPHVHKEIP